MKKHFTLIELLVVIAIIAILAGLLLPALQKARDRGKAIRCISMRKQVGTFLTMYIDSYKRIMPTSWGDDSATKRWYSALYQAKITKMNRLDQYMGCPIPPAPAGTPTKGATLNYNRRLSGYWVRTVRKPAIKYVIADSYDGYYMDETKKYRISSAINPTSDSKYGFYPWHGLKSGSMLFFDGHVEDLKMVNLDIPSTTANWYLDKE